MVVLHLIAVAGLFAAAGAIGAPLLKRLRLEPAFKAYAAVCCGLAVITLVALVAGMTGVIPGWVVLLTTVGGGFISATRHVRRAGKLPAIKPQLRRHWPVLAIMLPVALFFLGSALCPPYWWDELVYHVTVPRRWHADGALLVYGDLPYSAFPSGGEILFWVLGCVSTVETPRLVVWAAMCLSLLAIYLLLQQTLERWIAAALAVVYALTRSVMFGATYTHVEIILTMYVAAMVMLATARPADVPDGDDTQVPPWWLHGAILGLPAGAALGVKLTALPLLCVPAVLVVAANWKHQRRECLRTLAVFGLAAAAVAAPFYLRAWIHTGNPVYPYFARWFTNDPATLAMSDLHHRMGSANFGQPSIVGYLTTPFRLATPTLEHDGAFGWQYLGLLAALLAAACRKHKKQKQAIALLAAVAAIYTFWFLTSQQARFLTPTYFLVVIGGGLLLGRMPKYWRRGIAIVLVVVTLACIPHRRLPYYLVAWKTAVGAYPKAGFLHIGLRPTYFESITAVHERTEPQARVLFLFEHRLCYYPRRGRIGTPHFQERLFTPMPDAFTAGHFMDVVRNNNFNYILFGQAVPNPDRQIQTDQHRIAMARAVNELIHNGDLVVVWENNDYFLLKPK